MKFEFRSYIYRYPSLFYPIVNLNYKGRHLAVTRDTDIVIEGFPRSANSFSVEVFEQSQEYNFSIAHHLHAPAQVIRASHLSIPAILLIRPPVDTILSLRGLDMQIFAKQGYSPSMAISLNRYLTSWIDFYSILLPYSNSYVISLFDDTIQDFNDAINTVNIRFNKKFSTYKKNLNSSIKKTRKSRGYHARPSKQRDEFKIKAQRELDSSCCQASIDIANRLYRKFVEISIGHN